MNVDYKKYSHSLIFLTFAGILLSNISCKDSIVDPIVKHNKIVYLTDKDGTVGIISTNYINHQIFVMDLDGMNQNNISLSPDTDFVSIDYAPLTKKLLSRHVTINASYYYTMNLDGTQKKIITSTFQDNFGARFTPDGKNIVYSSFGTHSDIFKVDIDGISRINLTLGSNLECSRPIISPNGKQICFSGDTSFINTNSQLYLMDFDGSNRTRITNDTIRFGEKLFSLNGTQIFCLASGNYYNDQIVRINIDGTNLVKLTTTELPYSYDYIQLSPDGNKLLFTQWNGQNSNIYVIDTNGANLSQLTTSNNAAIARYTSDGSNIIYIDKMNGVYQIFIMDSMGNNKKNLSNNIYNNLYPLEISY